MRREKFAKQFMSKIASINAFAKELHQFWADSLDITWPQWTIMAAISDLEGDQGSPVNVVAKTIHVYPAFVTTESKVLEKKGLVRRLPSRSDARVVELSLTDEGRERVAMVAKRQQSIHEFIFAQMSEAELKGITNALTGLAARFEKATLKVAVDF